MTTLCIFAQDFMDKGLRFSQDCAWEKWFSCGEQSKMKFWG